MAFCNVRRRRWGGCFGVELALKEEEAGKVKTVLKVPVPGTPGDITLLIVWGLQNDEGALLLHNPHSPACRFGRGGYFFN